MKNKIMRRDNHRVLHAKLAPTCFATMLALGMVMPVQAAVIADNSAAQQPSIHTGTNGATIVDINKASAEGVSHNIYSQFNVDQNGVILNNSGVATNTQLAGQINGNANMAGGSAKVILNEVRSSDPSQLNGMVEVAGQSAQVIIANPSGITCDGCGFINTSHATLTTGTATFDNKGNVSGLDVKKGQVVITGKGMDTSATQYTDIIARSVKVNAQLKANELNIITGSNHIAKNGRVKTIEGVDAAPQLALDVSSLGSMYANKIYMQGTEAGVGVRIDHTDLTANDALSINVNGVLENDGGRITGGNDVSLAGTDVMNRNGQITSSGMTTVSANNVVDNTQGKITSDGVSVYGKTTLNGAGEIRGMSSASVVSDSIDNRNGTISSESDLSLGRATTGYYYGYEVAGLDNRNGSIDAKGDLLVDVANVNNSAGHLITEGVINVNTGTLINDHGLVSAGNENNARRSFIGVQTLNNDNGAILIKGVNSQANVNVNNMLTNHSGSIQSEGSLDIGGTNGFINNASGTISAAKDLFTYIGTYYSDANSVLSAGDNADLHVTQSLQNAGLINAGHDMSLNLESGGWYGSSPAYNTGTIAADGNLFVQMNSSEFNNIGTINANQMDWMMSSMINTGEIHSRNDINLIANSLDNSGKIIANNDANISASWFINNTAGQIKATHDVSVAARGYLNNAGNITADNNINLGSMGYSYSYMNADNTGTIIAGNALNMQMDSASLYNGGTLQAKNALSASVSRLTNEGVISSDGDVTLNVNGDLFNNPTGKIVGNTVTTTGYVNNMGTITQTGVTQEDNPEQIDTTVDNGDTTADYNDVVVDYADNNEFVIVRPDGTPDGFGGVWENGKTYRMGDIYNGKVVEYVVCYPGFYYIGTAA